MDWLTEYFDLLLPVALVLLFLFQRMFVKDEEGGPLPSDTETEEEARRIQEEIRRKIIARQQGRTHESDEARPAAYEEQHPRPATFPRREMQPAPFEVEHQRQAEPPRRPPALRRTETPAPTSAVRDFQEELRVQRERLRKAQEAKEDALHRVSSRKQQQGGRRQPVPSRPLAPRGDLRSELLADLATRERMKRAFLLKEIVDRPVALRDRPDVFSNWE